MLRKIYPYLLLILILFPAIGQSQSKPGTSLTVTDINNKSYSCRNITLEVNKQCLLLTPEAERSINPNHIVEIRFAAKASSKTFSLDLCEVVLNNHDIVRGNFKSGTKNIIVVESPSLGTFRLNYEQLLIIKFSPQSETTTPETTETDEDILTLLNGDKDQGIITAVNPQNIIIKSSLFGKERTYETKEVAHLVFTQISPPPQESEEERALIITHDGSRLTGQIEKIIKKEVTFRTSYNLEFRLPFDKLKAIYFKNPQWTYLSDLEPIEVKEYYPISAKPPISIPFLWNYQRDKSIHEGKDIYLEHQAYYKGLGVHANCELTYQLNGLYKRLFSLVGLDDASGPGGSVHFLVYADDRKVYESPIINWGTKPIEVALNINQVKTLKLVVTDAGDGFALDRAAWASARIVK